MAKQMSVVCPPSSTSSSLLATTIRGAMLPSVSVKKLCFSFSVLKCMMFINEWKRRNILYLSRWNTLINEKLCASHKYTSKTSMMHLKHSKSYLSWMRRQSSGTGLSRTRPIFLFSAILFHSDIRVRSSKSKPSHRENSLECTMVTGSLRLVSLVSSCRTSQA